MVIFLNRLINFIEQIIKEMFHGEECSKERKQPMGRP
jgi:hypothetical protein